MLLRKHKENGDIELALLYFNSTIKIVLILNAILINLSKKPNME